MKRWQWFLVALMTPARREWSRSSMHSTSRTKTDYWSHNQFFDAAASVEVLADWAADLRRRYVLSD